MEKKNIQETTMDDNNSKRWAVQVLADEINDIILQLEKAETIMDDITNEYFGKNIPPEGWELQHVYKKYDVKSAIVEEYLMNIHEKLDSLEELLPHIPCDIPENIPTHIPNTDKNNKIHGDNNAR